MNPPSPKAMRDAIRYFATLGGYARGRKLSKKRLREIAMLGVAARARKRNGKS